MTITVIHPTTLNRLSTCKLQYYWSRDYKPKHTRPNLEFGLAIHYALEKYYEGMKQGEDMDPVNAFKEYMDENAGPILQGMSDPGRELGIIMLLNYVREYKDKDDFKIIHTEKEIARKVPIPYDEMDSQGQTFYVGARVDGIIFDNRLKQYFVLEHKTFEKFYPMSLSLDHQYVIEKWVAEGFLKKKIAGVLYNGLRKRAEPTAATRLFERHPIYVNREQVNIMLHRVYWQLKHATSNQFRVYPEPATLKCNMCEFRGPCDQRMKGGDYEFLLANLFDKRTESDEEWDV